MIEPQLLLDRERLLIIAEVTFADRGRHAVDAARKAFDTIDRLLEKQITPHGLRRLRRSLVEVLETSLEPSVGAAVTAAAPPGPARRKRPKAH